LNAIILKLSNKYNYCRGTVSKVSKIVSGRKPFAKEESEINYDCNSEEEWREENEEGEYFRFQNDVLFSPFFCNV